MRGREDPDGVSAHGWGTASHKGCREQKTVTRCTTCTTGYATRPLSLPNKSTTTSTEFNDDARSYSVCVSRTPGE